MTVGFHDVRLPEEIERGALGGPGFNTTVLELSSGFERRNIEWSESRGAWDVGYGLQRKSLFTPVLEFFYARRGRAFGFRFKDWTDFQMARQAVGQTDGSNATFQIFRRYPSGTFFFDRRLTKIVDATQTVWVNGVQVAEGGGAGQYQLDDATGVVTLGATLAGQSGTDVEVQCEFDVPVRFDTDRLELVADTDTAATIPQIPIVELRQRELP